VAAAAALCEVLSGCAKTLPGGGPDIGFIDEGKAKDAAKPVQVKGSGPLFPLAPGRTWQFLTVRGKGETFPSEVVVGGPSRLGNGEAGTLLLSRRQGKVFRAEVFRTEKDGSLTLLGLGETEKRMLTLTPPVPFLKDSPAEGDGLFWRGTVKIEGKEFPATAYSRISATEKVDTMAGDYVAYRVDHILSVSAGSRRVDYPAVYWLVPGVGVVRRRLADRGSVAVEDLKKAPPTVSR
jgi:hypothetical protein